MWCCLVAIAIAHSYGFVGSWLFLSKHLHLKAFAQRKAAGMPATNATSSWICAPGPPSREHSLVDSADLPGVRLCQAHEFGCFRQDYPTFNGPKAKMGWTRWRLKSDHSHKRIQADCQVADHASWCKGLCWFFAALPLPNFCGKASLQGAVQWRLSQHSVKWTLRRRVASR